jgi:tRNA-2-methylthio-N6-dimethylallyladenosine synthase
MGLRKKLYISTMGCQMNVYDTEQIERALWGIGYEPVDCPESADLIIANTCAIREKAEQKAFSFLGRTADLKRKKPDLIVGIGGCVAQQEGKNILKRVPQIDLIFGTDAICRLPDLVRRIEKDRCRIVDVAMKNGLNEIELKENFFGETQTAKFITIMRGCDNFCTYCVVPYVRGRERSRLPESIIREVRHLVNSGVRDITLLGQNVNSYGLKEGLCSFPELIRQINEVTGNFRIRFTTSHPKDLSWELMEAFGSIDKLCSHIHLPVQSGSNAVLKRMNRKYTREHYLEKVDQLRKIIPDIALTSDIIVGFPGETPEDFYQTLDLIKRVEYDSLFIFSYSDRPNAPAAAFPDKVPNEVKIKRLQEVLDFQERITMEKNASLTGKTVEVLVEGKSKKSFSSGHDDGNDEKMEWSGRTSANKVVNFIMDGNENYELSGKFVRVRIKKAMAHSVWGKGMSLIDGSKPPDEKEGENQDDA